MTETPPPKTEADIAAAAQKAADRREATRRAYDEISSPYDKPSLSAKERKAYERKVLNIGLVLIMLVIAAIGIAAHKLISGIDDLFGGVSVEFQLPDTPFSPLPSPSPQPAPQPPQPTRMNLPDRTVPTADPAERTVTGRIIGTAGGIDTARGIFAETVLLVRFLIPETGQICSISATVPPNAPEPQGDAINVTYNAEAPSDDICNSARIVFEVE